MLKNDDSRGQKEPTTLLKYTFKASIGSSGPLPSMHIPFNRLCWGPSAKHISLARPHFPKDEKCDGHITTDSKGYEEVLSTDLGAQISLCYPSTLLSDTSLFRSCLRGQAHWSSVAHRPEYFSSETACDRACYPCCLSTLQVIMIHSTYIPTICAAADAKHWKVCFDKLQFIAYIGVAIYGIPGR